MSSVSEFVMETTLWSIWMGEGGGKHSHYASLDTFSFCAFFSTSCILRKMKNETRFAQ